MSPVFTDEDGDTFDFSAGSGLYGGEAERADADEAEAIAQHNAAEAQGVPEAPEPLDEEGIAAFAEVFHTMTNFERAAVLTCLLEIYCPECGARHDNCACEAVAAGMTGEPVG